ncbi:MAG: hypothetical protein H7Z72_04525, partial [Bacteroidetes bacterium]|nr:hypothetical protein [Fibrella sp.]
MLAASVLAGQALTRDLEHQTAAYLYALPVTDKTWFTGKFVGTYLTVSALALFYPIGLFAAAYVQKTPLSPGELAGGFVKIVGQNVFLAVSVGYALTVFTRRMAGAYLAMFALGLYALLTQSYRDVVAADALLQLLDPFGIGIVTEAVERAGATTPDLGDTWLISRLLWLGLTFGLLTRAETRFSFEWFAARPAGKPADAESTDRPSSPLRPALMPSFTPPSHVQLLRQLTSLTAGELMSQVGFRLALLALLLATIGYALFYGQPDYLAEPLLPTTARMTALRQPLGLFIGLFLLVWTGELAFRERTTGFWVIYDTLPHPTYLTALAKLLTMLGVAVVLTPILFGVSVGMQLGNGKTPIEWPLYAEALLMDGLLRYGQLIALALFVSILTGNRFLAHAISASLLIVATFAPQLTWLRNPLWRYSFLPGSDRYSDLIGYGQFTPARPVFHELWWGVAVFMLILAIRNWPRGVAKPVAQRVRAWRMGVTWPYALALLTTIGWIADCAYHIGRNGYATDLANVPSTTVSPAKYQAQSGYTRPKQTRSELVTLVDGRQMPVNLTFYHPYNVDLFAKAIRAGLTYGERVFGPYPHAGLQLTETPSPQTNSQPTPARIALAESFGWTADRSSTDDVDYIYYRMMREVLTQWFPGQLSLTDGPGKPFLAEGVVEYLTAQALGQRYGRARLKSQLARYRTAYTRGRNEAIAPELSILETDAVYVGRDRAALVLTSIGQVWGDDNLTNFIGGFYRTAGKAGKPVTAAHFGAQLDRALPDSLRYLTTYLRQRVYFEFQIGRVSQLPNLVAVQIIGHKWQNGTVGERQETPMADYVPVVLLDANGRECYRTLILPSSGQQDEPISLPVVAGATEVIIDPLGAWGDGQADNRKRLVQRR